MDNSGKFSQVDWVKTNPKVLFLLRLAASSLFLARGFLYLSDFAPLSTFFWNEDWLKGPVEAIFGTTWEAYAAHSDLLISKVHQQMGALFLICGIAVWWCGPSQRRITNGLVWAGTICLLPFWLLRWVDANLQLAMLIEHFLQWGTPMLLLLYGRVDLNWWRRLAWLFVSLTFIGHGQYAAGLGVPINNDFINMTQILLGVEESGAKTFLWVAGLIDFALPVLMLIPLCRVPAAGYAAFWGLVTAASRVVVYWTPAEKYYGMHPWLAEAVVRLPHGLVPLVLLLIYLEENRERKVEKS